MTKHKTPIQSIKAYCKESCCCGDMESWKNCKATDCYLFPYRIGRRPSKTTQSSDGVSKQTAIAKNFSKEGNKTDGHDAQNTDQEVSL
jgi:hypothetical protein